MVVDPSVLLAIFYNEQDADSLLERLESGEPCYISTASLVEASSAVMRRLGVNALAPFSALVQRIGLVAMPFDEAQQRIAVEAYRRYGRSLHRAGLNLGDCFSYALARHLDQPLLFKGNDFALTDIRKA
jgi:ribonuclease VapC